MTDPMTLRERVALKSICAGPWAGGGEPCTEPCRECLTQADAAIALITEAYAKVAEDMERKRHDAVGHPLIPEFTPHIANRIRQMGKP